MLSVPEIQKALDEVCPMYGAVKWALFGSYAHGTATEDSDVDVLVEFKEKPQSYHERLQISVELEERISAQRIVGRFNMHGYNKDCRQDERHFC